MSVQIGPIFQPNYQLPITNYQLPITNYQLPITNYQLPITNYQLPTTNYQLPITNYQLPITNYQLPMNHRTLQGLGLLLLATAVALLMGILWQAWLPHQYTIQDGSQRIVVRGRFATVADVLAAAGVRVATADTIYPPPHTPAHPETPIAIERARAIQFRTTTGNRTYWTRQTSVAGFLAEIGYPLTPTDKVYADGRLLPPTQLATAPLPQTLEVGDFLVITIQDGANQRLVRTTQTTVAALLAEAGISLFTADAIIPAPTSRLLPEMVITIHRSRLVTVVADGRTIHLRSNQPTAEGILAEANILLTGYDYTIPPLTSPLPAENPTVQVVRVTESLEVIDTALPYESLLYPTDTLEIDQRGVLQEGVEGILRQRVRVRYENGVEVTRLVDAEWVAREAQPEIIGYGTAVVIRTLETADGPLEYWRVVRMRVTSYRPDTSGREPDDPAYGITASGLPAGRGVVAVDPRVVPFRSEVYVPGYGRAIAGDTGGGVLGRWVDLGYSDDLDEYVPWSGYVNVYYLIPVPPPEKINYLIPTELP